MKVRVQFFAQLRDLTGIGTTEVELNAGGSVSDLLENLYKKFPALRAHDSAILFGAGVEFVDRKYKLKPGDEISIMPPVQGG
ncbi:MAG TPA: MoaD/ThiS family protein [Chthoniobacterales bacterium]|nr:MoaD/ThiS family protein [Chthoniobacterales bacterium]